jgi:hypothetical protein
MEPERDPAFDLVDDAIAAIVESLRSGFPELSEGEAAVVLARLLGRFEEDMVEVAGDEIEDELRLAQEGRGAVGYFDWSEHEE